MFWVLVAYLTEQPNTFWVKMRVAESAIGEASLDFIEHTELVKTEIRLKIFVFDEVLEALLEAGESV
jgi:hypothetical protein